MLRFYLKNVFPTYVPSIFIHFKPSLRSLVYSFESPFSRSVVRMFFHSYIDVLHKSHLNLNYITLYSMFFIRSIHSLVYSLFHSSWLADFTLETDKSFSDEQIVIVRLMWKRTNKFFDEQIVWYLAVWKDDFSQTICPSRRTSRRQSHFIRFWKAHF